VKFDIYVAFYKLAHLEDALGVLFELLADPAVVVEPGQDLVAAVDVQEAEVVFLHLK
jgi:hypothetical protein